MQPPRLGAIADVLIPQLRAKFSDRGLLVGSPPDPIAVFPARCEAVGPLTIYDDGDEVTIDIANVAHGHVNPYDQATSEAEIAQWVTDCVVNFLEELFADRVLLWAVDGGRVGGWRTSFDGAIPRDIPKEADLFVWSRELG
jgi:hypothetical protein